MIWIIFGIGAALLAWGIWRFAMTTPPARAARILKLTVVGILIAAVVVLLVVGLARLAAVPGIMVIPFLWQFVRGLRRGGYAATTEARDSDPARMTVEQAAEILGVTPGAPREEVIAAHARQRALREADGASSWALSRIDRARDLLLRNA